MVDQGFIEIEKRGCSMFVEAMKEKEEREKKIKEEHGIIEVFNKAMYD
jgi:hypothetical protein